MLLILQIMQHGWLVNGTWKGHGWTHVNASPYLRYYTHEEKLTTSVRTNGFHARVHTHNPSNTNISTNQWTMMMIKTLHTQYKFESMSLHDKSCWWHSLRSLLLTDISKNARKSTYSSHWQVARNSKWTERQLHSNNTYDRWGRQLNGSSDGIKASAGFIPYVQ
jgi:hypothetical protein